MTMKDEEKDVFTELSDNNRISPLDFKEPELHDFDATSIFELDESQPEKKSHRIFGKRSTRRANVKIKENIYETEEVQEPVVEEVVTEEPIVEEEVVAEEPIVEEKVVAEEPVVEEEVVAEEPVVEEEVVTEEPVVEEEIPSSLNTIDEEEAELDEAMEETLEEMEADDVEDDFEEESFQHKGLYDDKNLELFEDKKHFYLSQYSIVEEYLHEQSSDGYHFVRHEGKKYYFVEGQPANYYYSIDYFREEPSEEQWNQWERDGWKLISKEPGKRKKDLGWLIFRNLQKDGEYKKEIDNDEEKYRFFKKYSNSCRSNLFVIFICMFCCLITAFLQYRFNGYEVGIGISIFLFVVSFILFCSYYRMLRHAKKRVRLLKARLRVKEANRIQIEQNQYDVSESEAELETDWNTLSGREPKKKKKRRRS